MQLENLRDITDDIYPAMSDDLINTAIDMGVKEKLKLKYRLDNGKRKFYLVDQDEHVKYMRYSGRWVVYGDHNWNRERKGSALK